MTVEPDNRDAGPSTKALLQSLSTGVALIEPSTGEIEFENARFFEWFPPVEDKTATIGSRISGFDLVRARARLSEDRPFAFETESKGGRAVPIAVEVRFVAENKSHAIVECRDISKQKQAEYMLASYSQLAEKNARELQREKERVEKLLLNIMPRSVYEELKDYGTVTPQRFDHVSVLMLDFVGFTDMAVAREPGTLITELNDIFTSFDRIVELHHCERIKTIGDAYMAVSGLPEANPEHAQNVARAALRMRRYVERRNQAHPQTWLCRIGISSEPVIGSIVGVQKYVYDIFGPGVNLAARLENISEAMQITCCERTYELIKDQFHVTGRGPVEIKGFGPRPLYTVGYELNGGR